MSAHQHASGHPMHFPDCPACRQALAELNGVVSGSMSGSREAPRPESAPPTRSNPAGYASLHDVVSAFLRLADTRLDTAPNASFTHAEIERLRAGYENDPPAVAPAEPQEIITIDEEGRVVTDQVEVARRFIVSAIGNLAEQRWPTVETELGAALAALSGISGAPAVAAPPKGRYGSSDDVKPSVHEMLQAWADNFAHISDDVGPLLLRDTKRWLAAPPALTVERLAALLDEFKGSYRDLAAWLLPRLGSVRPAPSEAATQMLVELAEAAQGYLDAQACVGVTEDMMRRLHQRLASLAGPHLRTFSSPPMSEAPQ